MKHIFTLLFLLFATIAFAQNSQENMEWQWAKSFGGTNNPNGLEYYRYNNPKKTFNLIIDFLINKEKRRKNNNGNATINI